MVRWIAAALSLALAGCTQEGLVLDPGPPAFRVDRLAAGPYHTCAIQGGTLSCWGRNGAHQLGSADITDSPSPRAIAGADWAEVAAGEQHTCGRRTGGSAWCWGDDSYGQAGVGPGPAVVPAPAFVSTAGPVAQLSTNYDFTCAIDLDGSLWCWGQNDEGQLAQDDPFPAPGVNRSAPAQVETARDWTLIDAGQGHACGLRGSGALFCWGRNSGGELGLGPGAPGQIRTPQPVGLAADWLEVRSGQGHTCGRRAGGSLWCWGQNESGQLGTGDGMATLAPTRVGAGSDWTAVTVDTFHSCGLRGGGSLWCWGRNLEGQLGTGDHADHPVPVQVGADQDWAQVSAGRFHTCARKSDGSLWCWGQDTYGQLGTGDLKDHAVPARIVAGP